MKGKLSFTLDDEELDHSHTPCGETSHSLKTAETPEAQSSTAEGQEETSRSKRLGPNNAITNAPKAMTKSALSKEAHTKDRLRKEFLIVQDIIKNTNIVIPFVFYDGTNIPGGSPRMKKGDPTWLFLDRARKVGAELGVGGADSARREWARVSVDDLMLVRHEIIIPHVSPHALYVKSHSTLMEAQHYDFYYFIMNETQGFQGSLFDYTNRPRDAAVSNVPGNDNGSLNSGKTPGSSNGPLEGAEHDPNLTKVVDRRWYERNKHIYPASIWEEFDPTKDYAKGMRKDVQGNSFFFS